MSNFNMDDPAKQEQIRRGHHEYVPTAGKHGSYVRRQYKHQEYPKMMRKLPRPEFKAFLTTEAGVAIPQDLALQRWQVAVAEWDAYMSASVVNNAAEEKDWLKKNG